MIMMNKRGILSDVQKIISIIFCIYKSLKKKFAVNEE